MALCVCVCSLEPPGHLAELASSRALQPRHSQTEALPRVLCCSLSCPWELWSWSATQGIWRILSEHPWLVSPQVGQCPSTLHVASTPATRGQSSLSSPEPAGRSKPSPAPAQEETVLAPSGTALLTCVALADLSPLPFDVPRVAFDGNVLSVRQLLALESHQDQSLPCHPLRKPQARLGS